MRISIRSLDQLYSQITSRKISGRYSLISGPTSQDRYLFRDLYGLDEETTEEEEESSQILPIDPKNIKVRKLYKDF